MDSALVRWVDRLADRAARSLGLDDPGPAAAPARRPTPPAAPAAGPVSRPLRPVRLVDPVHPRDPVAVVDGQGAVLARVLDEHRVDAVVTGSVTGPSVTTWLIRPGHGVKVAKVMGLAQTMAMELGTPHVRIVPVVDGYPGVMAVEVPAPRRVDVWLPALLGPLKDERPLLVVPGVDTHGRPVLDDLAKMPHLLIAGATGAGKSECLNSLLCTLLSRATPRQVRLVLIDPKRVELLAYRAVPHLAMPIIVEPKEAVMGLQWAVGEMERRYELLAAAGVSHVDAYNELVAQGTVRGEHLAYLVVAVDELGDLMLVAKDEVEESVVRLTQLARAAGIHLVLATQRPSVDVVTGRIKANLPVRLAFATSSGADSQVILDQRGAEKLQGAGDGLYLGSGRAIPVRVQGPRVSAAQIRQVVDAARALPASRLQAQLPTRAAAAAGDDADEELLQRAIVIVRAAGEGSISMLRRHLGVGHPKAARLMDLLEQRGVVGPANGVNAREVLPVTDPPAHPAG